MVVQGLELGALEPYADAVPAGGRLRGEGRPLHDLGGPRPARSAACAAPPASRRPDWEIFAGLALAMGGDLGFETLEELQEELGGAARAARSPRASRVERAPRPPSRLGRGRAARCSRYPLLVDEGRLSERRGRAEGCARESRRSSRCTREDARRLGLADGAPAPCRDAPPARPSSPLRVTEHVARGLGLRAVQPARARGEHAAVRVVPRRPRPLERRRWPRTTREAARRRRSGSEPDGLARLAAARRRGSSWCSSRLLIAVMLYIWMERKVIADMQTRIGPMRAGPARHPRHARRRASSCSSRRASRPRSADTAVYSIAPLLAMLPAFLAFAVIPFGTDVHDLRPRRPVPARRPEHRPAVGAGHDLARRLRRRAGRMVERLELPAARRASARARR